MDQVRLSNRASRDWVRVAGGWFGFGCLADSLMLMLSEDQASRLIHLQGGFAKTKKATNILRPAIDVSFLSGNEEFLGGTLSTLKKKKLKKLFSPYKIIDSENFIKVSQNPNKVARDTQGLPTVPHNNDFGGVNFKGLASKYLLLMATSPYKVTFSNKKS